ncbi:MAG: protein jag [Oscillospiraceae bacterium]|nr:protein jag [Oscillospiraceae bacterium]
MDKIKSIEVAGKTADDAIEIGLQQLNLSRDDVSVEILERAKSGFLGFGGVQARVKLTFDENLVSPEVAASLVAPNPEIVEPPKPSKKIEKLIEKEASAISESIQAKTEQFLSGLLSHMNMTVDFTITETDDGHLRVDISGSDAGAVIGRRGETLDALQYITSQVINHGEQTRVRVNIDVQGYRQKKEETLIAEAKRVADKALKYHKNFIMEPMNSFERHVVHTALQEIEGVETSSVGRDPQRSVVVLSIAGGQPANVNHAVHGSRNRSGGHGNHQRPQHRRPGMARPLRDDE